MLFPRRQNAGTYGASTPVHDEGIFWRMFSPSKTHAGVSVTPATAMNLPVVYAAISLIADSLSMLPVDVIETTKAGRKVPVKDHPAALLLNGRPNPYMTAITARQTKLYHTLGWGNGYQEIERTQGGEPVGLWPLMPDSTNPIKVQGEDRLYYQTSIGGQTFKLPQDDVLHIPALGYDGYKGYSPVTVARQAIGLGLAMEEFGAKFFGNDAKSGGFLLHPGKMGEEAQKNVTKSFEHKKGLDHAHRVKVLEEGMKYVSTTIAPEDAQFLGSREFQIAEIARIFRIPLVLLQSMEKTSSWGSGIESLMLGYVIFTITPWAVKLEQEYDSKLLTEDERKKGLRTKINLNALLRGDMKARAAFYKNGINDGWLTRNEARAKEDLNPLDGLDEPLVPLNMSRADRDARDDEPATDTTEDTENDQEV